MLKRLVEKKKLFVWQKEEKSTKMNRGFVNIIVLGFGFMFLFTAFQTMGNIEVSTLTIEERKLHDRADFFIELFVVLIFFYNKIF